jgi:hypothetical protein
MEILCEHRCPNKIFEGAERSAQLVYVCWLAFELVFVYLYVIEVIQFHSHA